MTLIISPMSEIPIVSGSFCVNNVESLYEPNSAAIGMRNKMSEDITLVSGRISIYTSSPTAIGRLSFSDGMYRPSIITCLSGLLQIVQPPACGHVSHWLPSFRIETKTDSSVIDVTVALVIFCCDDIITYFSQNVLIFLKKFDIVKENFVIFLKFSFLS